MTDDVRGGARQRTAPQSDTLLDALDGSVAVTDEAGVLLRANASWQRMAETGECPGVTGAVGSDYLALCGAAGGAVAAHAIRDVIQGRLAASCEEVECDRESGTRWYRRRVARFADGGAPRALVSYVDITPEKRAEAIRAAEKRVLELGAAGAPLAESLHTFARLMEALAGGEFLSSILLLDRDGARLRHCAAPSLPEAYCRAIDGAPIGPAAGSCGTAAFRRTRVVVTDIAADPLWADYRAAAEEAGLRACWSTPILSSAGEVLGTFATYYRRPRGPSREDLSLVDLMTSAASILIERQRVEEERARLVASLRESEAHFRTLAEAVPQMVWGAGPDGVLDYFNQVVYDYTGLSPVALRDAGWSSLLPPEDRAAAEERWARSIRTGEDYETEFRVRAAGGDYRWFLVRALPVRDDAGRVARWFGTCTDVHDRKRLEETLREADRRKDDFLATLAHELRNTLAPISNYLQVLAVRGSDPGSVAHAREVIDRQVRQMVRLVDDLLDLSRITRGKVVLQRGVTDLAEVIGAAVETSRPLIDSRQHRLSVQSSGPLVVEGDPARLTQVLTNLLNNAAKYTEVGGDIRLEASRDHDSVVVRVRDTGVGISAEMLPRVFDMFAQEEASIDRSLGGLGLGLPIVERLVRMHGGSVEAQSAGHGRGSMFVVRLPRWKGAEALPATQPAAPPPAAAPKRILVVDDHTDSAESLAMLLGLDGHVVEVVHDGLAAIERAGEFGPEVVFLDINLPKLDGYGVVERLRGRPGREGTMYVALTGYGDEDARRRSARAGFHHHLVKPIDFDALAALLAQGPPAQTAPDP